MSAPRPVEGGIPIARLDTLPGPEAVLVLHLRLWSAGAEGQARVRAGVSTWLGAAAAGRALDDFDALLSIFSRFGRRGLVLHDASCDCVGSDEAVFAHFVMTAATGEREDAMLIASLMVRADMLAPAVVLAQSVGLDAARIALRAGRLAPPTSALH